MRQVLASVQPKSPDHPRAGQAGVVWVVDPTKPDSVGVRWDIDQVVTVEAIADLRQL